jgi:hypothetical protein
MAQGSYICTADYEFPVPVDRLDAECTFHQVTVPNRAPAAPEGGKGDCDPRLFLSAQDPFDLDRGGDLFTQKPAHLVRWEAGQILFLAMLALAAQPPRAGALVGMFCSGATAVIAPDHWDRAPGLWKRRPCADDR